VDGPSCFSPDGKRLYFGSRRPTHSNPAGRDWNIWYVEKSDPPSPNASPARTSGAGSNHWGEPKELAINSPKNDANPTVAADGTLYFASDRDSQPGYMHIYRARFAGDHYEQPEKLGPEINGGEADLNPYISPDQKFLIFASYRKDNLESGGNHYERADLYVSENQDGHWMAARHLEHGINTAASEGNPTISGKWFYFSSERSAFAVPMKQQLTTALWQEQQRGIENGGGNIYRIPVEALEPKP
jgi:Tol biopolymer transport system component